MRHFKAISIHEKKLFLESPSWQKDRNGFSWSVSLWFSHRGYSYLWGLTQLYRGINMARFGRKSIWSLLEPHVSFKKVIQGSPRQIWLRFSLRRRDFSALLLVWWLAASISRAVVTREQPELISSVKCLETLDAKGVTVSGVPFIPRAWQERSSTMGLEYVLGFVAAVLIITPTRPVASCCVKT